ncbi:MCE family protein [Nocardioides dubius]|uniref:Phospholipid/cholesterol/gamma-HCH transport system substrate-binding protein n=1 Tax=Nocardioides dubius TaxID=317019 RepID=A0ABP4EJ69_9ACTN
MKRLGLISAAAVLGVTATGCGLVGGGVYETDLPGGADLGSDPITMTADFEDVLDLVPQSSVKVDNVEVGQVTRITLNKDGHSARVELKINRDAQLPEGTGARLQQTSLLGEKFVALLRPTAPTATKLGNGAHLGIADTSHAAEVEEVLGALSLVLNGGGVGQFQEISKELQKVSAGRPDEIKAFLRRINTFVSGLDDRKESLTAALDGLDRLGASLQADKEKIVTALEDLSPGMQVLVDQRKQLVAMLTSLDKLSKVTVDTLNTAQKDIIADFKALEPILEQLAKAGADLPESLQILLTYPFPDSVLEAIKGDYFNGFIVTNFRTPDGCAAFSCSWPQPGSSSGAPRASTRVAPGLDWDDFPGLTDPGPDTKKPKDKATPSGPPPTLLTPTDTALPGLPSPTVTISPSGEPTTSSPSPSHPAQPTETVTGGGE